MTVHKPPSLAEQHIGCVWRVLSDPDFRHYRDRSELEGDAMEALVMAERKYDPSRGVPFAAFACLIIRHTVLTRIRLRHRTRVKRQIEWVSLDALTTAGIEFPTTDDTEADATVRAVWDAFALKATDRQRQVVAARYLGIGVMELARQLGLCTSTVGDHRTRAAAMVKELHD